MRARRGEIRHAIELLRRQAAEIVECCDAIAYWSRADAEANLRLLPARIRELQACCAQALEALSRDGIS